MKSTKGITLIALVITIIVLLILAGVTIAAITGNESAPNKAVEARNANERGAAKDAATLLVESKIQSFYEDKYVNRTSNVATALDYLKDENVLGNGEVTGAYTVLVEENPDDNTIGFITVKKENVIIADGTVEPDGKILWNNEVTVKTSKMTINGETIDLSALNKTTVAEHYGKTVTNVNGVDYGLFYVDYAGKYGPKGTVYLRAKSSVTSRDLYQENENNTTAMNIMKDLNPSWKSTYEARGYTTQNERYTLLLCNPSVGTWSGIGQAFKDKYGATNVNYVIGGPSVEMLLDSYNDRYKTTYMARYQEKGTNDVSPGYSYSLDGGTSYSINNYINLQGGNSIVGGMYVNSNVQWLCSPCYSAGKTGGYPVCDINNARKIRRTLL